MDGLRWRRSVVITSSESYFRYTAFLIVQSVKNIDEGVSNVIGREFANAKEGKKRRRAPESSGIRRPWHVSMSTECVPNYATSVALGGIRFFSDRERHEPLLTRSQNFVGRSVAACSVYSERSSLRNCTLSHKHEESWQKASRVGLPSISFRLLTFARVVQTTSSRRVVSTRSIASSIASHRWTLLGGTRGKATRHQRVLCAEQSARLFPLRRDEWSVRRDGENRTGPRVKVINYFSNVFASQSVTRLTFRFYVKPRP